MRIESYLMLVGVWLAVLITAELIKKHRHTWRASAVDHGVMNEPRRNATAILYVCTTCGEARSRTVAGTYELQQIREPQYQRLQATADAKSLRWSDDDKQFARKLKVSL